MKRCPQCKKVKKLEEFAVATRRKDGRQSTCKSCKREWDRQIYLRNPQKYAARNMAHRAFLRRRIVEYLQSHPCTDCGQQDVVVLEFDHVGDDKVRDVSSMMSRGMSWSAIAKEITKCEVVCANDHRRRTARRGDHYRWSLGELADPPGSDLGVLPGSTPG
jgi:Fe-S cluster biosynthesis and repair protein YggX